MKYIALSAFLLIANLLYSSWSTHISKQYVKSLRDYKDEVEKNLKLKSQIEGKINYANTKDYAKKAGFISINWDKVLIME